MKEVQVMLAIITGICGIIVAVGEKDIYGEFSFLLFLTALIPYVVATAILIGLGWLGDIFCTAFADIHFYLRSLNKVAHGSTNGEKNGINTMPSISDQNNNTWKCRNCGRILKTYQTTCTCGQKNPKIKTQYSKEGRENTTLPSFYIAAQSAAVGAFLRRKCLTKRGGYCIIQKL